MGRQEWMDDAACRYVGTHLFFSTYDGEGRAPGGQEQVRVRQARAVCAKCPVWRECRFVGIAESAGVWGGMATHERQEARAAAGLTSFGGPCDNESLVLQMRDDLNRAEGNVFAVLDKYPGLRSLFIDQSKRTVTIHRRRVG